MKLQSILALAPCLLLPNAASAREIDAIVPKQSRHRAALDLEKSNDRMGALIGLEDVVETSPMYDCGGIHWAHPADQAGMEPTVVKYDYDMLLANGRDPEAAVASLQETLLRSVGGDIFANCGSGAAGRKLSGPAGIAKITSNPADEVLHESCAIKEVMPGTACHAVTGYITAYSASNEFVRRLGEASVQQVITDSVEKAMKSGALLTDDVKGVYYLGDRAAYKDSWWSEWGMYLIISVGSAVGLCLVACWCRRLCRGRAAKGGEMNKEADVAKAQGDDAASHGTAPDRPRRISRRSTTRRKTMVLARIPFVGPSCVEGKMLRFMECMSR